MSARLKLTVAVGAVSLFTLVQVLSASASSVSHAPASAQSVIVVFKNQDRAQPATRSALGARRRTIAGIQGSVLQQLASGNARDVHSYTALNAVSATVSPAQVSSLRSDPAVAEVVPNGVVHLAPPTTGAAGSASGTGTTPLPGACAPPGKVQLEPEALKTMSVDSDNPNAKTARSLGITGSGVTVGFIADAIDPNNKDFIRPNGQHVVTLEDFSGFGTSAPTSGAEGFGDASAIAAQGREVYDVSQYSALPLNRPCNIRIEGVAPGANVFGLVAFGASNVAPDSSILEAIDYAITTAHVNVLNESFGINNYPDDGGAMDLIAQADDQAVAAGITVVEATGDAGVTSTTGEAATDPNVISAGASTDNQNYIQDGFGGTRFPEVKSWSNDQVSSLSSGGFDQRGRTIDVVAPGESDWALCSTNQDEFGGCASLTGAPSPVQSFGGTSQSSPMTAGVAALVIQAYEKTHRGTAPTPALVKQLIVSNTDDIGAPADQQGSGRVDAYKAVLAAENYNQPASGGSAQGRNVGVVTTSPTQLNAVDQPGTAENLTDTVTNESGSTQHLTFSGRTLGAYRSLLTTQFTLSDSDPQTPDYGGVPINYQRLRFRVPAGENRLDTSVAYHPPSDASLNARVRITLIDPNGTYVGDSRPQGNGNFGDLQIANPAAGTWTAYVYSRDADAGGYIGPVEFGASAARYAAFGRVSPSSTTLAPGRSVAVQVRTSTPAQPGDASGAIVVQSSPAHGGGSSTSTTVPVTLRSLIPAGNSTFSGTVTGGNGRAPISGQEFFYQLDVPAGKPELNATITVQDPGNQFGAYLINPQGEAVAYATNMTPGTTTSVPPNQQVGAQLTGAQLHTLNPGPGRWRLAVVFAPVVSGNELSSPFQVSVNQQAVPASGAGLPECRLHDADRRQVLHVRRHREEHGNRAGDVLPRCAAAREHLVGARCRQRGVGRPAGQRQHPRVPGADQLDAVPGPGDDRRDDTAPVRVPVRRRRSGPGLDGRHHGVPVVRRQPARDRRVGRAAGRVRDVRGDRSTDRDGHRVGERRHEPVRQHGQLNDRRPGVRQCEPGDEPCFVCADLRGSGPDRNDSGHDHAERSVGHERHRDAVPRRHGVLRVRLDPGRTRELPAGR